MREEVDEVLWCATEEGSDFARLGFTETFLKQTFNECWHVLPNSGTVKAGDVLMTIETNDGLMPIKSPFAGRISYFNYDALNFPEKLTDRHHILTVVKTKAPAKTRKDYVTEKPKKSMQGRRSTVIAAGDVEHLFRAAQDFRLQRGTNRAGRDGTAGDQEELPAEPATLDDLLR